MLMLQCWWDVCLHLCFRLSESSPDFKYSVLGMLDFGVRICHGEVLKSFVGCFGVVWLGRHGPRCSDPCHQGQRISMVCSTASAVSLLEFFDYMYLKYIQEQTLFTE